MFLSRIMYHTLNVRDHFKHWIIYKDLKQPPQKV